MHFKVLHNHVMTQPITLVPILPLIKMMTERLFILPIQMYTIAIEKIKMIRNDIKGNQSLDVTELLTNRKES